MSHQPESSPTASRFDLTSRLRVPPIFLDETMARAYQLYRAERHVEADILCRGLTAIDPTYGWVYSLHAAVLRRLGRLEEALAQVERGLTFEPSQPRLLAMRGELLELRRSSSGEADSCTPPTSVEVRR